MKVVYGIADLKKSLRNNLLIVGVFDGLHIGHQKLIKKAVKRAKALNVKPVLMTFSPHPVHVLYPNVSLPFIVSFNYRLKLMEQLGVAACVVVKFSKSFSRLSPQNFIKRYWVDALNPKEVFIGDDFRFGQDRSGGLSTIKKISKESGFKISILKQIKGGAKKISSTRIRQLIIEGKLNQASKFLDRPVSIMGEVVKGKGCGKKFGFPTANIYPSDNQILPPFGAYAVLVEIGKNQFKGMTNVGVRPTVNTMGHEKVNIETNIFDFNKKLYGKKIIIKFIKKIRNEKNFKTIERLCEQLKKDEQRAKVILEKK